MYPYLKLFGIPIPMYGLLMTVGFFSSSAIGYIRLKKRSDYIDENDYIIIVAITIATALICAKIAYIFASYGIVRFLQEILKFNFNALFEDGLVYYGGLIGALISATIAIYFMKYDICTFCDATVPCIALGHALGRIGCACAGCCYGVYYDGLCALHVKTISGEVLSLFPVQFLEALLNLMLFVFLSIFTRKRRNSILTLKIYLVGYSILRFFLEFLRGDLIRGKFMSLSTGQWISLGVLATMGIAQVSALMRYNKQGREDYSRNN